MPVKKLTRDELIRLIQKLDPKIKKSLQNTTYQDQEDLEQEIKLKILESYEKIARIEAPDFEQFLAGYMEQKQLK